MYLTDASTAATANAYVVALIAVLGAVIGAGLSAATQVLTSHTSTKLQLATVNAQLEHQTQEALRQERQRIYAKYFDIQTQWDLLTLETHHSVNNKKKIPDSRALDRTYTSTQIEMALVASETVMEYASKLRENCQADMHAAEEGKHPDSYVNPTYTRMGLMALMQQDLGIKDGVVVDFATGLRHLAAVDVEFAGYRSLASPLTVPGLHRLFQRLRR
jgi:type II secretory pathway pseudopilin PulG